MVDKIWRDLLHDGWQGLHKNLPRIQHNNQGVIVAVEREGQEKLGTTQIFFLLDFRSTFGLLSFG